MTISWNIIAHADFDLDKAIEDFNLIFNLYPDEDPYKLVTDVVKNNIYGTWSNEEIRPAIAIARGALLRAIGGIQMRMDLPI